jgi:hypothetical protein
MVTDELAVTMGTAVILFTIAFFSVAGYGGTMATGQVISMVVSIIP